MIEDIKKAERSVLVTTETETFKEGWFMFTSIRWSGRAA